MMARLKYRNTPTVLDGLRFSSKAEARRYGQLSLLQRAGDISGLTCQPRFQIMVGGHLICTYVADFTYIQNNNLVVEDVKSSATKTATYRLKKALMRAVHNIEIVEIDAAGRTIVTARAGRARRRTA